MKSKITIEIDFENQRKPIIQILHQDSPDVRDNLVADFLQMLGHESNLCKIEYAGEVYHSSNIDSFKKWTISPIEPDSTRKK